jgi:hypothetical protein
MLWRTDNEGGVSCPSGEDTPEGQICMGFPDRAVGVRSDGPGSVGGRPMWSADEPLTVAFRHAAIGLAVAAPDGSIHEANPSFLPHTRG